MALDANMLLAGAAAVASAISAVVSAKNRALLAETELRIIEKLNHKYLSRCEHDLIEKRILEIITNCKLLHGVPTTHDSDPHNRPS